MGQITNNLPEEIKRAMKGGDKTKLSTLRLLSSALSYEKIAQQRDLTDDEELAVVRSEAKKRKDAMEAYEGAGVPERAKEEGEELDVLKAYLPAELSDEELTKIVDDVTSQLGTVTQADMGKVIGAVMAKVGGRVDGKKVADMVRSKLAADTP